MLNKLTFTMNCHCLFYPSKAEVLGGETESSGLLMRIIGDQSLFLARIESGDLSLGNFVLEASQLKSLHRILEPQIVSS